MREPGIMCTKCLVVWEKWMDDPVLEVVAQNDTSINNYGLLEEIRSTILAQTVDATEQATNFVNYRGTPNPRIRHRAHHRVRTPRRMVGCDNQSG